MQNSKAYDCLIKQLNANGAEKKDGYYPRVMEEIYDWEREEVEDIIWDAFFNKKEIELAQFLPKLEKYDGIKALKENPYLLQIPSEASVEIGKILYEVTGDEKYLDLIKRNIDASPETISFVSILSYCKPCQRLYNILVDIYINNTDYSFDDYSFSKLKAAYYKKTKKSMEMKDFESFGIVDKSGMLTNAGALLADESPIYCSRLFCTRWNGIDKASGVIDALDDEEYTGSLILLLEEGMSFTRRNSKKMWRKESDRRVEYPEYPERSIFEGLVNGLVHRDYLDMGSEVHIDIFDDRLEIYSPGGMYDGTQKIGKRG